MQEIVGKLSSYPEPELVDYISKYKFEHRQIKDIVAVNGKRKDTKHKIECLTWNYKIANIFNLI